MWSFYLKWRHEPFYLFEKKKNGGGEIGALSSLAPIVPIRALGERGALQDVCKLLPWYENQLISG